MITRITPDSLPFFDLAPHWSGLYQRSSSNIPLRWKRWLTDRSSLTRRLTEHDQRIFSVEVVAQYHGFAHPSECRQLAIASQTPVWIRQVNLKLDFDTAVSARTVIPLHQLPLLRGSIDRLGNRSLGTFLFSAPGVRRDSMRYYRSGKQQGLLRWARRSVFRSGKASILVTEVFHEAGLYPPLSD